MFDVIEGLKILNKGRRKFSIEVEEGEYSEIKVTIYQLRGGYYRRGFIIPGSVIDGGSAEIMFMIEIHRASDDIRGRGYDTSFRWESTPTTIPGPSAFKFDGA